MESEASESKTVVKITDAKLNDLYTNDVLEEISGYGREELDRLGWINIVDPKARSLFEEIIQSVGKIPYVRECFDTNIICRDGSTRTLSWQVTSLAPEQFPVMLITARESRRKNLSGSSFYRKRDAAPIPANLWETIFDSLPDCVSIHDGNFTIVAANRVLCERLGLPRSELVGRKCHEIFHGSDRPVEHCVLVRAISAGAGKRVRREAYEPQFKSICEFEAVALQSEQSHLRGVIHTVRTPQDSADSNGRGTAHRSLDLLSRLANAVAHDYNNLISGIVGYTGMLEMLPDLPAKARHYVRELHGSASRLNHVTQRLLLFGRRHIPHPRKVNLREIVEETLASGDLPLEGREVRLETHDDPLYIEADVFQIKVVITDLVRNALEATEKTGGDVVVKTLERRAQKPFTTLFGVAPAGRYACFEVSDSGPGIEPERLGRVFEPFSQTEGRQVGKGLGLAIAYRVVSNHRGYIEAESEPGVGTRITVLFPAAE